MLRRTSYMLLTTLLLSAPAGAAVRDYSQPKQGGLPVSACLEGTAGCGKAAADAFCHKEGLGDSILFVREAAQQAIVLTSGKTCEGPACQVLARVKCLLPRPEEKTSQQSSLF